MRLLSILTATIVALSLNLMAKQYGEPITLSETTNISKILEAPETFVGKKVLVDGLITSVCAKRGCWMNIASDKAFQEIQIKVVDGVIVFPMSAQGKMAKVEGVVERLGKYIAPKVTRSGKKGEYKEGEGDGKGHTKNKYRIRALGAVITE